MSCRPQHNVLLFPLAHTRSGRSLITFGEEVLVPLRGFESPKRRRNEKAAAEWGQCVVSFYDKPPKVATVVDVIYDGHLSFS